MQACRSGAVSVVLVVHLAQFGKQCTKGMWYKILCAVKSWIVNVVEWRMVILFHGKVWYLLPFRSGIKPKHPAVLHSVLQGDWALAGLCSEPFWKYWSQCSCCQELQDFAFWRLTTFFMPGCLNIKKNTHKNSPTSPIFCPSCDLQQMPRKIKIKQMYP